MSHRIAYRHLTEHRRFRFATLLVLAIATLPACTTTGTPHAPSTKPSGADASTAIAAHYDGPILGV